MSFNRHPLRDDEPSSQTHPTEKNKNDLNLSELPSINDLALMEILDFDEMELNANRGGFVTRHQKQRLHDELSNDQDSSRLMLTIMLAVAAVLGVIMVTQGIPIMALVIGAGIIIAGVVLASYWQRSDLQQDARMLRVRHVQGNAQVRWNTGRANANLLVGNQSFLIDMNQASALMEFDLRGLRAYYTQHGKRLLSAEPLRDANFDKLKVEDLLDGEIVPVSRSYEADEAEQQKR
jgi:hypothetical protein